MFQMEQVSRKIIALRREKNMTQMELADRMGVSYQAVSNWERGNSMPDISKLPQLAEVFGCSVDELLGDKSGLLEAALKGEEQEYAQKNDIPLEELKTVVPVLKPDQVDGIASAVLAKNSEGMEVFYPFLTEETMRKLAERKLEKGESICTMLPFLEAEYLGEVALGQEEQGKEDCTFYPFLTKEMLREIAERKLAKGRSICTMLPFLERQYVEEAAMRQYEQGIDDCTFYPFLGGEALKRLAERKTEKGESICTLLPFLDNDFVNQIAMAISE